jgi:glycosyltransferase involved in cell wall biosynthesis
MRTVSLIGSVSRLSGGLFESVRRLHQELVNGGETLPRQNDGLQPCRRDSIEVNVLGGRDAFTDCDINAWRPVEVTAFEVRGPRAFGYGHGLSEKLSVLDPELVHVHGLWQYVSVAALRWHAITSRPYMVSPHGMLDSWAMAHSAWRKRLAWTAYEGRHLRSAQCIRALCEAEARAIRATGLTNPICIIPNGIDLPEDGNGERPVGREGEGLRSTKESGLEYGGLFDWLAGRKVLLYLGRIHPKKGLSNLVRTWTGIGPPEEWVLVIAGWDQGGHETELKRLAGGSISARGASGLSYASGGSIVFVGPQYGAEKRKWLQRSDAFILPSYSEGLPMALLEAWSFGKPVLATPECNLEESFSGGAAIRIGTSIDEIASGLRILFCAKSSTLEEMGARGRELVKRRFAWEGVVSQLRGVYRWMLGQGDRPNCVFK